MAPHPSAPPSLHSTLFSSYPVSHLHQHPSRVGGRSTTMHGGQETWPSPCPTSDILTWLGACFVQDSPLPRSTGCPILARRQYRPARVMASDFSQGHGDLQAPSDPGPHWKPWFTHSCMSSWIHLASLLPVSLAGLEAGASFTVGLRKLSVLYTSTMAFIISNHPDKTHSSHSTPYQSHLLELWFPRGSCLILDQWSRCQFFGIVALPAHRKGEARGTLPPDRRWEKVHCSDGTRRVGKLSFSKTQ